MISLQDKLANKYKWIKLPNGKFAVLELPVFQIFSDKEHGEVNESKAREIIENFKSDSKMGFYPRVFVGHHADGGTENHEGAGFLDDLKFDGKIFWANLVEIPPKIFKEMQGTRWPYRSVEYNDEKKKITGMALLESQCPYFQFPIMALERESQKASGFQTICKITKFQLEKTNMEIEDEKKEEAIEVKEGDKTKMVEEPDSLNSCQFKYQEMSDGVGKKLDIIIETQQSILELLQELMAGEEEEKEAMTGDEPEPETEPEPEPEPVGKKPGSVAMQLNSLRKEIDNLKKQKFQVEPHRASAFAGTFKAVDRSSILSKFQANNAQFKLAKEALQTWQETTNHTHKATAQKFQAIWPDAKKFVEFVVEQEEIVPGSFKRMTM